MGFITGKETRLATILANVIVSGGCTNVVNGNMTAGTFDSDGSGLLTYDKFGSIPKILGQVISGGSTTTSVGGFLTFTGITVSNAYLRMGPTPASSVTVSVMVCGIQNL